MARAPEIAREIKAERDDVENVLSYLMVDIDNHKRQPKPQPPEGGISLMDAERKYRVPNPTISRWVKRGFIPILLRTKRELYIDEAKLAEVIQRYRKNPGQGKRTVS